MKKFNKLILVVVCLFAFSISVFADDSEYDYSESATTYSLDEIAELELSQGNTAKAFSDNLGACKSLEYKTTTEEGTDEFDTITAETSRERDNVVEEKEDEGYTVVVTENKHDPIEIDYEFDLLNGSTTTARINGTEVSGYEGRSASSITGSTEFQDFEDDDVIVKHEITSERQNVSGSELFSTRNEANIRYNNLVNLGYFAVVIQNNRRTITNQQLRSGTLYRNRYPNEREAFRTFAMQQAQAANPGKEILELGSTINRTEVPYETEKTTSLDEANATAADLRASGDYDNNTIEVVTETDFNKDNATKTNTDPIQGTWNDQQTGDTYDEPVYDGNNNEVGFKRYFKQTESVTETVGTYTGTWNNYRYTSASENCEAARRSYQNQGYTNLQCTFNWYNGNYTLTGTHDVTNAFYDSYLYGQLFYVRAYYYLYNISYIATDYTVNYRGTTGNINIVRTITDKYYTIDGSRPVYTVNTFGTIKEDTACLNAGKTVGTGVTENIYFEIILLLSTTGIVSLYAYKKRHN